MACGTFTKPQIQTQKCVHHATDTHRVRCAASLELQTSKDQTQGPPSCVRGAVFLQSEKGTLNSSPTDFPPLSQRTRCAGWSQCSGSLVCHLVATPQLPRRVKESNTQTQKRVHNRTHTKPIQPNSPTTTCAHTVKVGRKLQCAGVFVCSLKRLRH